MDKRVLRWNFVFQYGWVLTNIFNSILLLPLYLKNIDVNTLGVWLATGNILGWMTMVDPGTGEVLQQRIAESRGSGRFAEVNKLIGSGLFSSIFILIIGLAVGMVLYFFSGYLINKNIHQYPNLPMALLISIIATGLTLFTFSLSGINQGLHNAAHVAMCSLAANFLFLFVNLILLFRGWGVMSIAIANLCRAVFTNVFYGYSMFRVMKKNGLTAIFEWLHFKRFIKIFSFTSMSKIVTGISYSVDMIVLARYLSPSVITMYEINKRPINITYGLIGRHSVALMPLISHAKGSGDKGSIMKLINQHFRFYSYAALFASFVFVYNYQDLISLWTGKGQFAGQVIINLLVVSFFLNLISYFISIVGYALGDIKMNSLYNIIRNTCFGVAMFFAAKYYAIVGTAIVSIGITLFADLAFYSWRLHKLQYLDTAAAKKTGSMWIIVIPVCFILQKALSLFTSHYIPQEMHFIKLVLNIGAFTFLYVITVFIIDKELRGTVMQNLNRHLMPAYNTTAKRLKILINK